MNNKNPSTLPQSIDAVVWAKDFVETLEKNPSIATDVDTMITWFVNSIMAGWDERGRRDLDKKYEN